MFRHIFILVFFLFFVQTSFAQHRLLASAEHKKQTTGGISPGIGVPLVALHRDSYDAGATVQMRVCIARLLGQPQTGISIKIYFSNDAAFDFGDDLLENFILAKPAPDAKGCLPLAFQLPLDVEMGQYHLIVVAQTEEGVLLSKTCSTNIWVSGEKP